jgi:hypothetical protein
MPRAPSSSSLMSSFEFESDLTYEETHLMSSWTSIALCRPMHLLSPRIKYDFDLKKVHQLLVNACCSLQCSLEISQERLTGCGKQPGYSDLHVDMRITLVPHKAVQVCTVGLQPGFQRRHLLLRTSPLIGRCQPMRFFLPGPRLLPPTGRSSPSGAYLHLTPSWRAQSRFYYKPVAISAQAVEKP